MTGELKQWLEHQCNRYVNGQCTTLGCLMRGGYRPAIDGAYDPNIATCEPHELLKEFGAVPEKK